MDDQYQYEWCLECGTRVVRIRDGATRRLRETVHTNPTADPARVCFLNRNSLKWEPAELNRLSRAHAADATR